MIIFLIIMLGCKVRQQKPSCMVSFCWTKPRTSQAGSTVVGVQETAIAVTSREPCPNRVSKWPC